MLSIDAIDNNELKEMVKALNASGLAPEKIKVVGLSKDAMVKKFAEQVYAVPDDKADELPDAVINFYNKVMETDKGDGDGDGDGDAAAAAAEQAAPAVAPEKGKKEKKAKEPKAPKEPKPPKEKKVKAPKVEEPKSTFGHKLNSQAGKIDGAIEKGSSMEDICKIATSNPGRVRNHIQYLRKVKNIDVVLEEGIYKVKKAGK
jgi:hypothetical protein